MCARKPLSAAARFRIRRWRRTRGGGDFSRLRQNLAVGRRRRENWRRRRARIFIRGWRGGIAIANRSLEAASQLAARVDGEALPLARVADSLARFDVVVAATGAALCRLSKKPAVEAALAVRRRPPDDVRRFRLCPATFRPPSAICRMSFCIRSINWGRWPTIRAAGRKAARAAANGIIDSRIDRFWDWLVKRPTASEVRVFRAAAARAQASEVAAARARLARGEDPIAVVERLARPLIESLVARPDTAFADAHRGASERTARGTARR